MFLESESPSSERGEQQQSPAGNFLARRLGVTGPWPWVTTAVCTIMVVMFLRLWLTPSPSWQALHRRAFEIWSGGSTPTWQWSLKQSLPTSDTRTVSTAISVEAEAAIYG